MSTPISATVSVTLSKPVSGASTSVTVSKAVSLTGILTVGGWVSRAVRVADIITANETVSITVSVMLGSTVSVRSV